MQKERKRTMNEALRNEMAEVIEFVLCIGQMKMITLKDESGSVGETEINIQHKENCELLEKMLAEKIKITDYEKFANMIKRCDAALLIGAITSNMDMPNRSIRSALEKYADSCTQVLELTA